MKSSNPEFSQDSFINDKCMLWTYANNFINGKCNNLHQHMSADSGYLTSWKLKIPARVKENMGYIGFRGDDILLNYFLKKSYCGYTNKSYNLEDNFRGIILILK